MSMPFAPDPSNLVRIERAAMRERWFGRFFCARQNTYTDKAGCVQRYTQAKIENARCPCLECAKVLVWAKELEIIAPYKITNPQPKEQAMTDHPAGPTQKIKTRKCAKCKKVLPLNQYKRTPDKKLTKTCKSCLDKISARKKAKKIKKTMDAAPPQPTQPQSTAQVEQALDAVRFELERILETKPKFNSWHEAFAILHEEVDEVWDEVKMKIPSPYGIKEELTQVAAVAIKAMVQTPTAHESRQ